MRERAIRWWVELPLLVAGYLLFGLARAGVDRGEPAATTNAHQLQRIEQTLHLDIELALNSAAVDRPALLLATGYFYRTCLVAVPLILGWLYVRRRAEYACLRTMLVILTLLDLPLVWLFPMAPPRMAMPGIVDVIVRHDILGGASMGVPRPGVNLLAAMPSMHTAWMTWAGYAAWSALRPTWPRASWLAWLLPATTAYVVIATGNHYVLDVVGGVALVAVGGAMAWGWCRSKAGRSERIRGSCSKL